MKRNTIMSKCLPKSHPARRSADKRTTRDEQERKDNGQFGSGSGGGKGGHSAQAKRTEKLKSNASSNASEKVGNVAISAGQKLNGKLNANAAGNAGKTEVAGKNLHEASNIGMYASAHGKSLSELKSSMESRGHHKWEIEAAEKAWHEQEKRG